MQVVLLKKSIKRQEFITIILILLFALRELSLQVCNALLKCIDYSYYYEQEAGHDVLEDRKEGET